MKCKTMAWILTSLLILSFGLLLYNCILGSPVDGLQVTCVTQETKDTVTLICTPKNAQVRLLCASARLQGDVLHVRLKKVQRLPWQASFDSVTEIYPQSQQKEIWVGGRQVWVRSE